MKLCPTCIETSLQKEREGIHFTADHMCTPCFTSFYQRFVDPAEKHPSKEYYRLVRLEQRASKVTQP